MRWCVPVKCRCGVCLYCSLSEWGGVSPAATRSWAESTGSARAAAPLPGIDSALHEKSNKDGVTLVTGRRYFRK